MRLRHQVWTTQCSAEPADVCFHPPRGQAMGSLKINNIIFVWQTCFTFSAHFSLQTPFPQTLTKAQGDTNKWKQLVIEPWPYLGATQWVGESGVKRLLGPKMRTCKIPGAQIVSCVAQFIVCILSKMYNALMSEGPNSQLIQRKKKEPMIDY